MEAAIRTVIGDAYIRPARKHRLRCLTWSGQSHCARPTSARTTRTPSPAWAASPTRTVGGPADIRRDRPVPARSWRTGRPCFGPDHPETRTRVTSRRCLSSSRSMGHERAAPGAFVEKAVALFGPTHTTHTRGAMHHLARNYADLGPAYGIHGPARRAPGTHRVSVGPRSPTDGDADLCPGLSAGREARRADQLLREALEHRGNEKLADPPKGHRQYGQLVALAGLNLLLQERVRRGRTAQSGKRWRSRAKQPDSFRARSYSVSV